MTGVWPDLQLRAPGQETGLSSLCVNMTKLGPSTVPETERDQLDNREYCTELIYNSADQDSDSGSNGDGRQGLTRDGKCREVGRHQRGSG